MIDIFKTHPVIGQFISLLVKSISQIFIHLLINNNYSSIQIMCISNIFHCIFWGILLGLNKNINSSLSIYFHNNYLLFSSFCQLINELMFALAISPNYGNMNIMSVLILRQLDPVMICIGSFLFQNAIFNIKMILGIFIMIFSIFIMYYTDYINITFIGSIFYFYKLICCCCTKHFR
jgi:hypothetical protein